MLKHPDPNSPSGWRFELTQAEHDAGYAAFLTGPIAGVVSIPGGSAYDVTEDWIAVKNEHVGHLHVALHEARLKAGHLPEGTDSLTLEEASPKFDLPDPNADLPPAIDGDLPSPTE